MMNVGGYHEYIGGCSVHRRDTMSTSGRYHEYTYMYTLSFTEDWIYLHLVCRALIQRILK